MNNKFLYIVSGILIAYIIFSESGKYIMDKSEGSSLLNLMADAIQRFEGWTPSSLSYRNNNPGNIRPSAQPWQGQVGIDSHGFVIFDSYENGRRALLISLTNAASGKSSVYSPDDSLYDFFSKYAPAADNNQPRIYAEYVAKQIGVDPEISIRQLV